MYVLCLFHHILSTCILSLNTGQGPAVVCSLYVMKCLISCQSPFNSTSKSGSYEDSRIKSSLRIKISQMLILRSVNKEWKNHHRRLLATVCLPWLFSSSCAKWNGWACCTPPSPETRVYWYITARSTLTVLYLGDSLCAQRGSTIDFVFNPLWWHTKGL